MLWLPPKSFRYEPIRTPARKLMGTPTPLGGTPMYHIPEEERGQAFDVPVELEGLPELKPEDHQYFGKLLKEVRAWGACTVLACSPCALGPRVHACVWAQGCLHVTGTPRHIASWTPVRPTVRHAAKAMVHHLVAAAVSVDVLWAYALHTGLTWPARSTLHHAWLGCPRPRALHVPASSPRSPLLSSNLSCGKMQMCALWCPGRVLQRLGVRPCCGVLCCMARKCRKG